MTNLTWSYACSCPLEFAETVEVIPSGETESVATLCAGCGADRERGPARPSIGGGGYAGIVAKQQELIRKASEGSVFLAANEQRKEREAPSVRNADGSRTWDLTGDGVNLRAPRTAPVGFFADGEEKPVVDLEVERVEIRAWGSPGYIRDMRL